MQRVPCGKGKVINLGCSQKVENRSNPNENKYPRELKMPSSSYYIDQKRTNSNKNFWSIAVENFYGFDTTLVFTSPPILPKQLQ